MISWRVVKDGDREGPAAGARGDPRREQRIRERPVGAARAAGMIVGVAAPVPVTAPDDPRLADFRNLVAGDRRPGTARGTGPVIVEGVPAVQRLLASPYRVRAVLGVPGRVAALHLPEGVPAYEADQWVL